WLGAYQAQAAELLQLGIDVQKDTDLSFTGEPQDKVVHEVTSGRADVGFVRTGLLEELAKDGKLKLSDFRILGMRTTSDFPFAQSTRLYPEWPFAVSPHTSAELAGQVAIALLNLSPESETAKKGEYHGWTIPADYQPVHELMKMMRFPPYDAPDQFSMTDVVHKYALPVFSGLLFALGLSLFIGFRFFSLNRAIKNHVELANQRALDLEKEVAARIEAEEGLRLSASVFENSNDGIMITNGSNQIVDVNRAFTAITGYDREEILGKDPRIFQSGRHEKTFYQALWKSLNETGHWRGDVWNRKKDGEFYIESLDITAVKNANGEVAHYVGIFSDITVLKESQRKLERLAHFDALTQLPNRTLLADRLEQSIALASRENQLLAVCFLDLDKFKLINDKHGHQIGDKLLINVATRLKKTLRAVDSIARLGGDEFVLLITSLKDMNELELILSRIMEAIAKPHFIDNLELSASASVGVTLYPLDDADPHALLRHADQAMYMAKRAGRNRFHVFDAEEEQQAQSRLQQLGRLRQALTKKEFALYYQPKVNMRSGKVIGLEALIRWNHPARGLVSPGEFLPLVEHSDVAIEIGDWVIREALDQLQRWSQEGLHISVSVNIAPRHLQQPNFVEKLKQHLAQYPKLAPAQLELEIVESAALEDIVGVRQLITSCQEMGVSFSLDDFGTGYSSLSYLKRLPIDTLKIDQSFVRDLLDNPEDLAIVEGVVTLAKVFQRKVIGEGVETPEHGIMLMRLGCDLAQGYGIARPMPAANVPEWHRKFKPDPQWALWAEIPWDYSDFPLLVAQSDHNGWVRAITRLVEGAALHIDSETIDDHHRCRFGGWYDTLGRTRYGNLQEFGSIEPIHVQVHQIGLEIVRQMEAGHGAAASALLPELYRLRDLIQEQLAILQRAVTMKCRWRWTRDQIFTLFHFRHSPNRLLRSPRIGLKFPLHLGGNNNYGYIKSGNDDCLVGVRTGDTIRLHCGEEQLLHHGRRFRHRQHGRLGTYARLASGHCSGHDRHQRARLLRLP
ncbi:MAG: EAL domain-containing protein, partial [Betaproteobacteria bacterium]